VISGLFERVVFGIIVVLVDVTDVGMMAVVDVVI